MAGYIPEHIIAQVQSATDIVGVISQYVPLKKVGRNLVAPCPFHKEKTPSFVISPDKGIFHCFGCGAGGNAIGFLMKYDGLEFPEAVKLLAEKTGIALPSHTPQQKEKNTFTNKLYRINELAAKFYQNNLLKANQARSYLSERGISEEIIKTFQLGFAPNLWEGFLNFCKQKKIDMMLILLFLLWDCSTERLIYQVRRNFLAKGFPIALFVMGPYSMVGMLLLLEVVTLL